MYPTRFLVIAACLPVLLALGTVLVPSWLPLLWACDTLIVSIMLADGFLAWRLARHLQATCELASTWSRGRSETIIVHLDHAGSRTRRIIIAPDLPQEFTVADSPRQVDLPPRRRAELRFHVVAPRRGSYEWRGVHIAVISPLGLWRRVMHLGPTLPVRVHPDLKQLGEYALLARADRLSLIGVRQAQRVGGDTEFERLRDYHSDDALNRMDWKATARRDHLTVRDYRTNQSQNLMLMVDAGRMMVGESGADGRSLLDHAIDAALLLAWVAIRQGDRVGLIAYADGIKRYVPARGGPRQIPMLVHALHDLTAERVESRHEEAFLHLERRERKRSLVVLITHVLDDVNADHLERHCRRLVGRHLPLAALLQDHDLHAAVPERQQLASALAADPNVLWQAGAAASILDWRQQVIDRLRRHGCLTIDTPADRLTGDLVSRYLDIKARHLL